VRRHRAPAAVSLVALSFAVGCAATGNPAESATSTTSEPATLSPASTPSTAPLSTAAATSTELTGLAATVYPSCTPSTCAGGALFTTCDAASSGADVFASCPLTPRLATQLQDDVAGTPSAPDPLGGGQDPEWATEAFNAAPSSTGGIIHVILGFGAGTAPEKIDLLVVIRGSELQVDDILCTGTDPETTDAFAPDWLTRAVCSS
jgi:hypothetical protein